MNSSTYPVIKINDQDINKTDFKVKEPTVFEIHRCNIKFEFLIYYKPSNKAVICGTGSIQRERYPLPFFTRHSWASEFNQSSIFYADPTLYDNDLTLAWYYGTNKRWYLEEIADILKMILYKMNVSANDTLCFGSSGGGYSSIVLATMLHTKATVINPQCNIMNYKEDYLNIFTEKILSDKNEKLLPERTNVINVMKTFKYMPYIHYIQNIKCTDDLNNQLYPFLKELASCNIHCSEKLYVDFYSDLGGHNAMPYKEYCLRVIENDINLNLSSFDSSLYLYDSYVNGIGIKTDVKYKNGTLSISIKPEKKDMGFVYAYYLINDKNEAEVKIGYSDKEYCEFVDLKEGRYRIKYYIKDASQQKMSFFTNYIQC